MWRDILACTVISTFISSYTAAYAYIISKIIVACIEDVGCIKDTGFWLAIGSLTLLMCIVCIALGELWYRCRRREEQTPLLNSPS